MAQVDKLARLNNTLEQALLREPFPVRGWYLDVTVASDVTRLWPLYRRQPETNDEGIVSKPPEIQEHLLTAEVTARAKFKFTGQAVTMSGRAYTLGPEAIEKQLLQFLDTKEVMAIHFDPKKIAEYSSKCLIPDQAAFANCVERWVKFRHNATAPSDDAFGLWMIAQLAAIKQNALSTVSQMLGKLANLVRDGEPDYWDIIEGLMLGRYEPGDAMAKAKGAITVAVSELYREPAYRRHSIQ